MDWKDFIVADWLIDRVGGGDGCGCGCFIPFMLIGAVILAIIYHPDVFLPSIIILILAVGLIVLLSKLIIKLLDSAYDRNQTKRDMKEQYRLYKKWYKKGRLTPLETKRLQYLNKWLGTEEVSIRLKALEEKEKQKAAKKEHKDIYY